MPTELTAMAAIPMEDIRTEGTLMEGTHKESTLMEGTRMVGTLMEGIHTEGTHTEGTHTGEKRERVKEPSIRLRKSIRVLKLSCTCIRGKWWARCLSRWSRY